MAKPRIFISSTCFDLNDVRSELTSFLGGFGFEVLNSQLKNFGVTPQKHSHTACLEQVNNADYCIVIIGRRRGGTFIASEKSITNEEYNLAIKKGIPIIIFVDGRVEDAIPLYKKNPTADFSSIVDDKRIFHFIDYIKSSSEDNWIHKYSNINDIKEILTAQFAYYLLLFSQNLSKSSHKEKNVESSKLTSVKFPSNIERIKQKKLDQEEETGLRNGLKQLHKVIQSILSSPGKNDNKMEKLKAIWIIAKYGELSRNASSLNIENDLFKDYAWSTYKGERVFKQLKPFGVFGDYDSDEDGIRISLSFDKESDERYIASALKTYVDDLVETQGEDGYKLFQKSDMRIYME